MANVGLLPNELDDCSGGKFLTFVVPASGGCDLKCKFCIIRQRGESGGRYLRPRDLLRFIGEAARAGRIFGLAVQGHEPLLPESIPFTRAILSIGQLLGVKTSIITNGTHLRKNAELLRLLKPTQLGVSLDSASSSLHDELRGRSGAWGATVDGIRYLKAIFPPNSNIAVASVMLPTNKGCLEDMPALLRELGINYWIVNPLVQIKKHAHVIKSDSLSEILVKIQMAADFQGVRLIVDDELDLLKQNPAWTEAARVAKVRVRTLPSNVEIFRLSPSGQCSFGKDILKPIASHTLMWRPGQEHTADFLKRVAKAAS